MQTSLHIESIGHVPLIKAGDDLPQILIASLRESDLEPIDGDIVCLASKVVSTAERRFVSLPDVRPGAQARKLHRAIQRIDPRVLQLMFDEANEDLANIRVAADWIGVRTKIGRWLTSAGIDKVDETTVLRLPADPDVSARRLGEALKGHSVSRLAF